MNFFIGALGVGLVLQWLVLLLVRQPQLLATPNQRSSHTVPTPTMGGISFVLIILAYLFWLTQFDTNLGWGLIPPLAVIALVGLVDDLRHVSATLRLCVHFAAAAWVLSVLPLTLPWWIIAGMCVALVWFINLYNFMDGTDGIAAMQSLVFVVGAQFVAGGVTGWAGDLIWVIAGSNLAFLVFNWPPAKIFMGDIGSGFLGLLLGVLVVYLWMSDSLPLVASLILLAAFWFDATHTLCVRILTQQEFTQAHRSHLYQHLAQRHGHLWTTLALFVYAVIWLGPLAWVVTHMPIGWLGRSAALVASCLPLAVLSWRLRAGYSGGTHKEA